MTVDRSTMVKTPILLFAIYGFWCPLWWSPKWKVAYSFYSVFASILLAIHMCTQLFNIIFNIHNLTELATNCLSLMPTINACTKAANLLINRRKIIALLNMFEDERCKFQDYSAIGIQRKYRQLFRKINVISIIIVYTTTSIFLTKPFFGNRHARKLPFLAWYPYALDTEIKFWATYAYEIASTPIVTLVQMSNVLLVISLMGQISVQLDILGERIIRLAELSDIQTKDQYINIDKNDKIVLLAKRRRKLIDCVHHHLFIFELAEAVQRCFVVTFAVQMLVSLIGIGTGAYQLARSSFGSTEFSSAGLFLACMMILAFPCCWFGNEVYLKSMDIGNAVYKMDWTSLENALQKDLLNIFIRARRPILFTSGPALPLSNNVFMGILQASYTAFTVLQQADARSSSSRVS